MSENETLAGPALLALDRLQPEGGGGEVYRCLLETRYEQGCLVGSIPLYFSVDLPDLGEPLGVYDPLPARRALAAELEANPNLREFAWYSPFLVGTRPLPAEAGTQGGRLNWTCRETGSVWDLAVRLRLVELLLQVLDGQALYVDTCRLLQRQRFLLLAAGPGPRYVRDPEGRFLAAQRSWAAQFIERPADTALLLERHACRPEEEAAWLVWRAGRPEAGLWDLARRQAADRAWTRHLARRWFLRRHDLGGASRLVAGLVAATPQPRAGRTLARLFFGRWPGQVGLYPLLPAGLLLAALVVAGLWPGAGAAVVLAGAAAVLVAVLLAAVLAGLLSWGAMALYPFVARLTAGIVVGLIAWVAMPDTAHDFAFVAFQRDQQPAGGLLAGAALLAALAYLYVEVYNRVEDPRRALARAARVFALGLAEALLLAAGLSSLGAGRLVAAPGCGPHLACIPVGVGQIYVGYVLLTACLSLAVGVFVQILWEDKPITEPL